MAKRYVSKEDKALLTLDIIFYILVIVMIVVFFITYDNAKWTYLWPAGLALLVRIISYMVKHKNNRRS